MTQQELDKIIRWVEENADYISCSDIRNSVPIIGVNELIDYLKQEFGDEKE